MLTIIKEFNILFPLLEIVNILAIFKINQFQLSVQVYSLLGQTDGERKAFFKGCKKGGHIVRLPPGAPGCHKRWKSLFFCEIWNNPTLPLFFIRPSYKQALQDMEFYDKFENRFKNLSKVKNPAVSKAMV